MSSQLPVSDSRLPTVPWVAVVGEIVSAFSFLCICLFTPLFHWFSWPEILLSWQSFGMLVGACAIAVLLIQRRPQALKAAILLAAYTGMPFLSLITTVVVQAAYGPTLASYAVWGLAFLGQLAALLSCLNRLTPIHSVASSNVESPPQTMQTIG